MDNTTLIGYISATCTTAAFLPQVLHTLRTRDTSGISLGMYLMFIAGTAGWPMASWWKVRRLS